MERLGDGTRPAPDHRLERPAPVQNVLTIDSEVTCSMQIWSGPLALGLDLPAAW